MATTLLQLRTRCKSESDNVNSEFVTDAEWLDFINGSYLDLYGSIVTAFGNDYFASTTAPHTFTTDGTNTFFALPADFFKLLGVDVKSGNRWVTLRQFAFGERNSIGGSSEVPASGQSVRVHYVPRATLLASDTDAVDGVNGWEEFVVIDACIKALAKEEADVTPFLARRSAFDKRLEREIETRDASGQSAVADTQGRSAPGMAYRLSGGKLWLLGREPGDFSWWAGWGAH